MTPLAQAMKANLKSLLLDLDINLARSMSNLILNEASFSFPGPPSRLSTYETHGFRAPPSWEDKEHIATIAEQKLGFVFSRGKSEPSLRYVLLQVGLLARLSDGLDLHVNSPS